MFSNHFITTVAELVLNEIEIMKIFSRNTPALKMKHETLCNDNKAGRLIENINIPNKITTLQCSLIRKLHDNCFDD